MPPPTVRLGGTFSLLLLGFSVFLGCGGHEPEVARSGTESVTPGAISADEVVLDLAEYLPASSRSRERPWLRWNDAEVRAGMVSGWGELEDEGEESYVWGLGDHSVLDVFVARPRALRLTFDGLAFAPPGASEQRVEVAWNGAPAGAVVFGTKRDRRSITVATERVRTGDNRLVLTYGYHARPIDVLANSADERDLAVRWYGIGVSDAEPGAAPRVESVGSASWLELPGGSQLAYHVPSVGDLHLVADGIHFRDDASLRIEIESTDGAGSRVHEVTAATAPSGSWSVPITTPNGALTRLALTAWSPSRGGLRRALDRWRGVQPAVALIQPRIVRTSSAATEMANTEDSDASGSADGGRRPDVVLYVIDTLRADHLGTYGYPRPTSPEIDRFAADATVFTKAEAQSSWTRTTMVSILTGLEPERHGIAGRDDALPAAVDTLAERLGVLGYQRAAVVTNGNVAPTFGLHQGFDDYRYLRESQERPEMHVLADGVNEEAFSMLGPLARDDAPFFLYLHTSDPHAPYVPPEPYRGRFAADVDPARGRIEQVHAISRGDIEAPPGTREAFIDLYDAEIAFNDEHFGRLLDRLRALGRYEDALIILVADHGEEFGEHGGWEHGKTLYAEQLRVPLIVKFPRGWGAGVRVDRLARQIDIAPTVLAALGHDAGDVDGAPLQALIAPTAPPARRTARASLRLDERRMRSVASHSYKLILDESAWVRHARAELFEVDSDPDERDNLYFERPIPRGFLLQLDRSLRVEARRKKALPAPERADVDPALRERLEALGYVN